MKRILETNRLYLRRFVPADAEMVFRLNGDSDVMRYMPEHARQNVSLEAATEERDE